MLLVRECDVRYGSVHAVRDATVFLARGEVAAVVGPNGAGKTSLFAAIAGVIPARGSVLLDGREIGALSPEARAAAGLAFVQDGRRLFPRLSVEQNLLVGAVRLPRGAVRDALARTYARFPLLAARRGQRAGTLSGGEGQLLAVARALVPRPRVLLVDEPFQGLSAEASALVLGALADAASDGAAVAVASPYPVEGALTLSIEHGAVSEVVA